MGRMREGGREGRRERRGERDIDQLQALLSDSLGSNVSFATAHQPVDLGYVSNTLVFSSIKIVIIIMMNSQGGWGKFQEKIHVPDRHRMLHIGSAQ